jgi:hypothetical protein
MAFTFAKRRIARERNALALFIAAITSQQNKKIVACLSDLTLAQHFFQQHSYRITQFKCEGFEKYKN